jgi:small subunit ribosomal protein S8e
LLFYFHLGISRDSRHKRSHTGAKRAHYRKKRKFELGRQPANTRIGPKRIHEVRVRGGNIKHRAMRLDAGNFAWGSEAITRKTRVIDVVYNASNNELVRTKTLVKSAIVQVDATPFRQWWEAHYGENLSKKKGQHSSAAAAVEATPAASKEAESKLLGHRERKQLARKSQAHTDQHLEDQFGAGRLYAILTSRPGQSGRADGYILEGKELDFYLRKIRSKK